MENKMKSEAGVIYNFLFVWHYDWDTLKIIQLMKQTDLIFVSCKIVEYQKGKNLWISFG